MIHRSLTLLAANLIAALLLIKLFFAANLAYTSRMYLAIDIGGSKTLVAVFDGAGKQTARKKFVTPKDYAIFLKELANNVAELSTDKVTHCCCAVPGLLDREKGRIISLGNLPWENKNLAIDISSVINNTPTIIENDAKLAGLAEAEFLSDKYKRVLYITISTGIGVSYIENGQIVTSVMNMEPGKMPLFYEDKILPWEEFASGRAMVNKYGLKASELTDPKMWQEAGERIAYGTAICVSIFSPEAVVFGGGAGKYAEKFSSIIKQYFIDNLHKIIVPPKQLLPAHYGNDSVVYGCYLKLKQSGY